MSIATTLPSTRYRLRLLLGRAIISLAWIVAFTANADFDLPSGQPLFVHANYDYAPSVIQEGSIRKFWWCGSGLVPGTSFHTDVIYYRTHNTSTGIWSAVLQVLAPTPSRWDGHFLCDPSVIRGSFLNPENGRTYSYAMYYTATDRSDGRNNRIGLAFSDDGITWAKLSTPVIYPGTYPTTTYGAGQASTYNSDGQAGIRIFYTDSTTGQTITRKSNDGINFSQSIAISKLNDAQIDLTANSDYAYDYSSGDFYGLIQTKPYRVGNREAYQFGLFRMKASDLFAGNGAWESLGFVSTNSTGFELNHNVGLLRNKYGNVTPWLPEIVMYFGAGENNAGTWDLATVTWRPNPSRLPLRRFYTSGCTSVPADHWVTTGYVRPDCGYHFELTLGYLAMGPSLGSHPLYGCMINWDHFLSKSATCEGQKVLGINGWIYTTQVSGTVPLYRCRTKTGNHFASKQSSCEGQSYGQVLGYIRLSP